MPVLHAANALSACGAGAGLAGRRCPDCSWPVWVVWGESFSSCSCAKRCFCAPFPQPAPTICQIELQTAGLCLLVPAGAGVRAGADLEDFVWPCCPQGLRACLHAWCQALSPAPTGPWRGLPCSPPRQSEGRAFPAGAACGKPADACIGGARAVRRCCLQSPEPRLRLRNPP